MHAAWFQTSKLWLPPCLWCACILLASSIPGDDLPKQEIPYLDKVVHLGIYGILGILLARTRVSFPLALGLAAIFGVIDEFYQTMTPNRSADPMDWVADVVGACMGILLMQWLMARRLESKP